MDSIIENLMKQVTTGDNLSAITQSVGGDAKGIQSALSMGLPLLMGSMAKSASTPSGAGMLTNMLTQTTAKNPLDDLKGYLGKADTSAGAGMVDMLLGGQMGAIQNAVSQKTGLAPGVISKLFAMVAPMLIGSIGKMFAGQKIDQNSLSSLLGEQSRLAMQSSPDAANIAKQFFAAEEKPTGIWAKLKKMLGM